MIRGIDRQGATSMNVTNLDIGQALMGNNEKGKTLENVKKGFKKGWDELKNLFGKKNKHLDELNLSRNKGEGRNALNNQSGRIRQKAMMGLNWVKNNSIKAGALSAVVGAVLPPVGAGMMATGLTVSAVGGAADSWKNSKNEKIAKRIGLAASTGLGKSVRFVGGAYLGGLGAGAMAPLASIVGNAAMTVGSSAVSGAMATAGQLGAGAQIIGGTIGTTGSLVGEAVISGAKIVGTGAMAVGGAIGSVATAGANLYGSAMMANPLLTTAVTGGAGFAGIKSVKDRMALGNLINTSTGLKLKEFVAKIKDVEGFAQLTPKEQKFWENEAILMLQAVGLARLIPNESHDEDQRNRVKINNAVCDMTTVTEPVEPVQNPDSLAGKIGDSLESKNEALLNVVQDLAENSGLNSKEATGVSVQLKKWIKTETDQNEQGARPSDEQIKAQGDKLIAEALATKLEELKTAQNAQANPQTAILAESETTTQAEPTAEAILEQTQKLDGIKSLVEVNYPKMLELDEEGQQQFIDFAAIVLANAKLESSQVSEISVAIKKILKGEITGLTEFENTVFYAMASIKSVLVLKNKATKSSTNPSEVVTTISRAETPQLEDPEQPTLGEKISQTKDLLENLPKDEAERKIAVLEMAQKLPVSQKAAFELVQKWAKADNVGERMNALITKDGKNRSWSDILGDEKAEAGDKQQVGQAVFMVATENLAKLEAKSKALGELQTTADAKQEEAEKKMAYLNGAEKLLTQRDQAKIKSMVQKWSESNGDIETVDFLQKNSNIALVDIAKSNELSGGAKQQFGEAIRQFIASELENKTVEDVEPVSSETSNSTDAQGRRTSKRLPAQN